MSNDILNPVMFYDDDYIDTIIVMMIITYLISYNPLRPLSSKKTLEICWLSEFLFSQPTELLSPYRVLLGVTSKLMRPTSRPMSGISGLIWEDLCRF